MDIDIVKAVCLLTYKMGCLVVGTIFCYFGYQLFLKGIVGESGDLRSKFGKFVLVLTKAAPGTFFAVLGATIIIATVWQGLRFPGQASSHLNEAPPALPEPGTIK